LQITRPTVQDDFEAGYVELSIAGSAAPEGVNSSLVDLGPVAVINRTLPQVRTMAVITTSHNSVAHVTTAGEAELSFLSARGASESLTIWVNCSAAVNRRCVHNLLIACRKVWVLLLEQTVQPSALRHPAVCLAQYYHPCPSRPLRLSMQEAVSPYHLSDVSLPACGV
jgi:hypothetical protein